MVGADVTLGPAICAGHCVLDLCHVTVMSFGVFLLESFGSAFSLMFIP